MDIVLCNNSSENNVINKNITNVDTISCIIKGELSIENPTFIITYNGSLTNVNYLYIPSLQRYYFITDRVPLTGGRYEIRCKVDVLESYKINILNLKCILDYTESKGRNNYLVGDTWVRSVKDKTDILNFDNGLLDEGEFILLTAGG